MSCLHLVPAHRRLLVFNGAVLRRALNMSRAITGELDVLARVSPDDVVQAIEAAAAREMQSRDGGSHGGGS